MTLFNFLYRKNFGLNPSSLASCKQTKKEKLKNFRVVQESIVIIHICYSLTGPKISHVVPFGPRSTTTFL